jgi:hypothetical protein
MGYMFMKNFEKWIVAIALVPTLTMAQPPEEELSPNAPEFNIEVMDAPAPAESVVPAAPAVNAQTVTPIVPVQPAQVPVVEPKKAEAPAEDKSVRGITLAPAVTLKPLGYNGERKQNFIEISPSIGLESVFKTANDRDVNISVAYAFIWDEFVSNRAAALRYFEHDVSGSAVINWTDMFSTSFIGGFNYSLWASDNREHAVFSDDFMVGTFKINDKVSVSTGYHLFYFNNLDGQFSLSQGNMPSDGDDIRQGNSALGGSDPFYVDPNSNLFNYDPIVGNAWFANNGLQLKTKIKALDGTSVGLEYEYVFATFTNSEAANWRGHFIVASITQDMPWKGGSMSLKDQVRLRNYQASFNDDGSFAANFRNRVTLSLDQSITETIAAQLWYRWEMSGSNADNYAVKESQHQINLGFTFSF